MKRTRKKTSDNGLFQFEQIEKPKIKRERQILDDPFIERHKGKNALEVLDEFLQVRKEYIENHYPDNQQIVLFEWDLYHKVLQRVIKGVNQNKLKI